MSAWSYISTCVPSETEDIDPAIAADQSLRYCMLSGHLDEVIDYLGPMVAERAHGDAPEGLGLGYYASLDGEVSRRDEMAFLRAVLERAIELRDHPERIPPEWPYRDAMLLPYSTEIVDEALRERATALMMERFHDRIVELEAFRSGSENLWFHADLGDELDHLGTVQVTANNPPLTLGVLPGQQLATTAATLVVGPDQRGGLVGQIRAELPLDTSVDERFPHLRHLFADAFGDNATHPHFRRTEDILLWMEELKNPAFTILRDELDQLLLIEDDFELQWAVENLGSWTMPKHLRYWLGRVRWRFDAFDWDPDGTPRREDRSRW